MLRRLPLACLCGLFLTLARDLPAEVKIQPDVVYGHKDGLALTYDVIFPEKPNGAGVLLIQSGGWYSGWRDPKQLVPAATPLLDKGFTVFIVRHGSSPRYAVPDAVADVRRSVRAIRLRAKEFGVDPERLGAQGGSAGGHLSLMLATTGDDGDAKAEDEVLRQSSRLAAVVAYYPPTDLRKWTTDPPAEIKKHASLKPSLAFAEELEDDVSPALHVTKEDAAVLLIHGDKDELVPLSHSEVIVTALEKEKVPHELIVVKGAAHGFSPDQQREIVIPGLVGWFEKHLAKKP